MQESDNLKIYKSGILKAKRIDEIWVDIIAILIAIVGCINFDLIVKISLFVLLAGFYLYTRNRINSINTDNKFLDEDIIQLKDLAYELETIKKDNQNNNKKLQQVTSIIVALHMLIIELEKTLIEENLDYNILKTALKNAIKNIFDILMKFYVDYQERITVALYYYCPSTEEYLDFISFKPEIMDQGKGRIWSINDNSHICHAVRLLKLDSSMRDFVYDNINEELPPLQNGKDGDEIEYVSSISIPILYDSKDVKAVLSITSNYPNRFKNANSIDFQEIRINKVFVDLFYAISQIIEVVMRKNEALIEQNIIIDILKDYKRISNEKLKEKHINILKEAIPFEVEQ